MDFVGAVGINTIVVFGLILLAVVGGVLIITASDDEPGPELEPVVTAEGLMTEVPAGWVAEGEFSWDYHPVGGSDGFDVWSVAAACPVDGCGSATLAEWMAIADGLPTFVDMRGAVGDTLFNLSEERLPDAYVARAWTSTAGRLIFVAAFDDGADG